MSATNIINKVRALLARASEEQNDNPHEREVAMKHAHRLMEEHAISMLEVTEETFGAVSRGTLEVGTLDWKRNIVHVIAALYGCAVSWPSNESSRNYGSVYIYGREESRLTVESISDYVITSIEKEWLVVQEQAGFDDDGKQSFCVGALYGIRETVRGLREERFKVAENSGQGLALLNQYEQWREEAQEVAGVKKTVSKPNSVEDMRVAAHGKRFGRKVRLEPRLSEGD